MIVEVVAQAVADAVAYFAFDDWQEARQLKPSTAMGRRRERVRLRRQWRRLLDWR